MKKQSASAAASFPLLVLLAGCGNSDNGPKSPTSSTTVQGDVGISDAPTPVESVAAQPATSIVSCKIDNGLPVAEVKVANTTGAAAAFSVEVQFESSDTILGSGLEFTRKLEPGQNQTIRMGNMQGDAKAVDTCKVIGASPIER